MSTPVEPLVIARVRAIDPSIALDAVVDVTVAAGRVEKIVPAAPVPARGAIDGAGCWLLPSFTDLRVRFGEPGFEYRETIASGLRAAAAGGFGSVCVLPDGDPPTDEAVVVEAMLRAAERAGQSELLPIGALTRGLRGHELAEYGALKDAGVVAIGDADAFVEKASLMRRILEYALTFDLLVMQQPTDHSLAEGSVMHEGRVSSRLGLRGCPAAAEQVALERDLALVRQTGARYHASAVSTKEAVVAIARAKEEGLAVTADVAVANLVWNDTNVAHYESDFRVVPPLRDEGHQAALRAALESGVIDAVTSNHSPKSVLEKSGEFDLSAPGMIGLESCLASLLELVREKRLGVPALVRALATAPCTILRREAPSLGQGSPANFVLVDPERRWTPSRDGLHSKSRNTPLWTRELQGRVLLTLRRGRILHQHPSLPRET